MEYRRLNEGLSKYSLVPAQDDIWDHITTNERDWYRSLYSYNDEHYKIWKSTGSVAGIRNPITHSLFFDFDSKEDISLAKRDTVEVVNRLLKSGIDKRNIEVAYSGQKGYSIEVETTNSLTPEELKNIATAFAGDLNTFDAVVYDAQRIVRITGTKHPKSGLYKIPLSISQLNSLSPDEVRSIAKNVDNVEQPEVAAPAALPDNVIKLKVTVKKETTHELIEPNDLDMTMRPKWLSEVRYALQEGFFPSGEGIRNHAFMILAATYKKNGFNKITAYKILKGVAEVQANRNNSDAYTKEELWKNVVNVVYHPAWKGGIYKDTEDPFLVETAKRLGIKNKTDETEYNPAHIHSIHDKFKDYVKNIDKNTILTGIKSLDEKVFISVGANVGLVGAPGSGKSSLALNILNNTSKAGIKTVFASFDMARTRMYEKILYKISGLNRKQLYEIFDKDPKKEQELYRKVQEEFGNVYFFDKSASSVQDIKDYVTKCNDLAIKPEDKIKLVLIDYFEMIASDIGDDTASSKKVAQELQGIVNTMDVAQIVLLQPNKMSGDMREPIKSYTNIKGSSFLAQSFRIALGIYREGYDPTTPEHDKYLSINILKNDLGETGSLDFAWNGRKGEISEIDDLEKQELESLRKQLSNQKLAHDDL